MIKGFLGDNYYWDIRKILNTDDKLLPDSIIDADLNQGAAEMIFKPRLDEVPIDKIENNLKKIEKAAQNYLAAVICLALRSRTSAPPYNVGKYRKDWYGLGDKCLSRANNIMKKIMEG